MRNDGKHFRQFALMLVALPVAAASSGCLPAVRNTVSADYGVSPAMAQGRQAAPGLPDTYRYADSDAEQVSRADPTRWTGLPYAPPPTFAAAAASMALDNNPAKGTQENTKTEKETLAVAVKDIQTKTYGSVLHVETDEFQEVVLETDAPVLVDFYADWCGPCRRLAPALEQLARQRPDAKIVKVDIDKSPELAARYRVESIPTVMVFKQGDVTARQTGLADRNTLKRLLGS
jgi:thioredoxin 1